MKTVFITGGSRGIGECAVKEFSHLGYNVAFTYFKSEDKAKKLEKSTGACGIFCDVSKSEDVENAVKSATKKYGKIDILINNAGISEFALFTDITDEMWHKMIDTNLSSAFYASRAVLPGMISRKDGVIINVSSMWGQVGASCETHYSVSKAGMIGLTKSMARELASRNITVNAVAPGFIETEMTAVLSDAVKEGAVKQIPVGRFGQPEDIANMVKYLASEEAAYVTGQVICVDGGMAM